MEKITLKDRDYFRAQKPTYQFISCEYSFANLTMWGDLYDIQWRDINGVPLIYIARDKSFLFPHIPNISPKDLSNLSNSLVDEGYNGEFSQVPEEYVLEHPSLTEYYTITKEYEFSDYIHSTERLCLLQGKKLRKKRNLISQFIANNPDYKIKQLSLKDFESCLKLTDDGLCTAITGKNDEIMAINLAFSMFTELSLNGIVIYVKDTLAAFSIFSRQIDDSYVVHFEKNDRNYKGSAQVINQKTAEYLSDKCEFINREQDLGIPGLRKAKLSYDPDIILLNYELIPKR